MNKLLPCPFCGTELETYPCNKEYMAQWLRIKHMPNGCIIENIEHIRPSKWNMRVNKLNKTLVNIIKEIVEDFDYGKCGDYIDKSTIDKAKQLLGSEYA